MDASKPLERMTTFRSFIREATSIPPDTAPVEWPTWAPGQIEQVTDEAFNYFLDVLPPRWMNHYSFAYGEGAGEFTLFWEQRDHFYSRRLTMAETKTFCSLSGVPLHV